MGKKKKEKVANNLPTAMVKYQQADRTVAARGYKIEELRLGKALSQEDLAAKSGLSVKTIRSVVRGEEIFPSTLRRVADALDVPVEELISIRQEPLPRRARRFVVCLTLGWTHEKFDEADLPALLKLIAMAAGIKDGIEVIDVKPGSVKVFVEMTEADIVALAEAMPRLQDLVEEVIGQAAIFQAFPQGSGSRSIHHPIDRAAYVHAGEVANGMRFLVKAVESAEMPSDPEFQKKELHGKIITKGN